MIDSTLCHIEKNGCYLMMHRVKKKNDLNHDKWVGLGGKFEPGETPDECVLREVREEAGVTLTDFELRGVVTFISDRWEGEYMYLYSAYAYEGELTAGADCAEGVLEWVPVDKVCSLPIWEGDRLFFEELERRRGFFRMLLRYEGERLVEHDLRLGTAPAPWESEPARVR